MKSKSEEISVATDEKGADNNSLKSHYDQNKTKQTPDNKKLLALIGHDVKSPMGLIISFLSILKDEVHVWERNKIEDNIDIALDAAKKTFSLLDNLLKWAWIENNTNIYSPANIDFQDLLNEEIANIELFAMSKQIRINSRVSPDINVFADTNMVRSIMRNLLGNAIKYSHKSGKIDISCKKGKEFLEIRIRDYGVGINNESVSTLFNPGSNFSTMGTENETGTGFGLFLCKDFIEIHNCKIWIISNQGKGSEFRFTLPLAKKQPIIKS